MCGYSRGESPSKGEEVVKEWEKKIPKFWKWLPDPEFTLRVRRADRQVQIDRMTDRHSYPFCVYMMCQSCHKVHVEAHICLQTIK